MPSICNSTTLAGSRVIVWPEAEIVAIAEMVSPGLMDSSVSMVAVNADAIVIVPLASSVSPDMSLSVSVTAGAEDFACTSCSQTLFSSHPVARLTGVPAVVSR